MSFDSSSSPPVTDTVPAREAVQSDMLSGVSGGPCAVTCRKGGNKESVSIASLWNRVKASGKAALSEVDLSQSEALIRKQIPRILHRLSGTCAS